MLVILFALLLASCGTRAPRYDYRQLAKAAVRLDMDIDAKDNHRLYIEVADWIGTPYRHGGTTRKGTDCSGFTSAVYKKVYRHKLKRSSEEQRTKNCRKVAKRNLKEGDLVFFHNGRKKRKATHMGIYLKAKTKHNPKPIAVGSRKAREVHLRLLVSFQIVRQVVEQGQ